MVAILSRGDGLSTLQDKKPTAPVYTTNRNYNAIASIAWKMNWTFVFCPTLTNLYTILIFF